MYDQFCLLSSYSTVKRCLLRQLLQIQAAPLILGQKRQRQNKTLKTLQAGRDRKKKKYRTVLAKAVKKPNTIQYVSHSFVLLELRFYKACIVIDSTLKVMNDGQIIPKIVTQRCEKTPVPSITMVMTKNPKRMYEGLRLSRFPSQRTGVKFSNDSSMLVKSEEEALCMLESISTILVIKIISNYYTSSGCLTIAKLNITNQVLVLFSRERSGLLGLVQTKMIIFFICGYSRSG